MTRVVQTDREGAGEEVNPTTGDREAVGIGKSVGNGIGIDKTVGVGIWTKLLVVGIISEYNGVKIIF